MDEDNKTIQEEYRIWKKNCPYLYDLVVTHALEWPSLTVQWLNRTSCENKKDYTENEIVLGTHTADGAQNHLMIARVKLPSENVYLDTRQYDDEKGEFGGYGGMSSKIEIKVRINHDGEVNRARFMPQDDYIIASRTISGNVDIFFIRDHESIPPHNSPSKPNIRCSGLEHDGYGIDWSYLEKGLIASSSDSGEFSIWNSLQSVDADNTLKPIFKIQGHDGSCEDIKFNRFHKDLFGTVGDDSILNIWDIRSIEQKKPKLFVTAHSADVTGLSFNPFKEFLLATSGNDKLVKIWDMRKLDNSLHVFRGHESDIFKVEWAPFDEAILASCGNDRRVIVWDVARIGLEQTVEDAEDGPPELLFVHGGHTSEVSDFSWNPNKPWVISSVSQDNIMQVWKMAENIYTEDSLQESNDGPISDKDLE